MGQKRSSQMFGLLSLTGMVTMLVLLGLALGGDVTVGDDSEADESPQEPAGVSIESLDTAAELFGIAGLEAQVFKYSGGNVDFWIELEKDGQTTEFFRGELLRDGRDCAEGYFIWTREADFIGPEETWRLAVQKTLGTPQASRNDHRSADAPEDFVDKLDDANVRSCRSQRRVRLWDYRTCMTARDVTMSIPSTLPRDEAFCVYSLNGYTYNSKHEKQLDHIIRVMCKVVSKRDVAATRNAAGN